MDLAQHKEQVTLKYKENQQFFKRLKKVKTKVLDKLIHPLHKEVFECTDCLKCANCCTTTGPLFTDKDINRIAKYFRIKPSVFTKKYLRIDEERDYVQTNIENLIECSLGPRIYRAETAALVALALFQ